MMIDPQPKRLHTVMVSTAPPKIMSEINTRTMVRRLPIEVRMGPQTPRRIYIFRGCQLNDAIPCSRVEFSKRSNGCVCVCEGKNRSILDEKIILENGRDIGERDGP